MNRERIALLELDGPDGGIVMYDDGAGVCFGPVIVGLEADKAMGLGKRPGDFFRTPDMDENVWVECYITESDRFEAFMTYWGENLPGSSDQAVWVTRWKLFEEYERSRIPELYGKV